MRVRTGDDHGISRSTWGSVPLAERRAASAATGGLGSAPSTRTLRMSATRLALPPFILEDSHIEQSERLAPFPADVAAFDEPFQQRAMQCRSDRGEDGLDPSRFWKRSPMRERRGCPTAADSRRRSPAC